MLDRIAFQREKFFYLFVTEVYRKVYFLIEIGELIRLELISIKYIS